MKKLFALMLALIMVFALAAPVASAADDTTLTLWTYPIGGWGTPDVVAEMIAGFEAANPGIKVNVEYLAYADGDDKVNTALEGGNAPDLIMEGPERLVTNWGAKGYMVDLADMWDDTDKAEIFESLQQSCTSPDGKVYEYPVCMIAHCMAVNVTRFEAAGVADVLDRDTHTWTTEGFIKAVNALSETNPNVAAIYCSGQGGDQGTRVLVNNLYGGTFTNPEHTAYTANSPENVKALQLLVDLPGINFDASINGGEEIQLFRQGILDMAFCWNLIQQTNTDNNDAGLTNDGDEIEFMAFPAEDGNAKHGVGIWGFGIFDNGDAAKIEAAKTFIKYFADGEGTPAAIVASGFSPARSVAEGKDLTQLFADDPITTEYMKLLPLAGDYYQVVPGWAEARTAWWNMLQQIGEGADVQAAVDEFVSVANAAAGA